MTSAERVSGETFASRSNLVLALRMSGWLLVLPLAKRTVSFERLARSMWRNGARERNPEHELFVTRLACRLTRFSGSNCLDRSLMLYRYLGRAGARPTLVLGIDKATPGRGLGHAWVLVEGTPVVETAGDIAAYEPVVAFGPGGRRLVEREFTRRTAS